ncbi:hypothetical protein F4809DRAFT_609040 [Biscogniauxia mediterranea]|nr:hypothetical protein F4809DRAFT_609040 [Biscogniauxia mediterranea]
MAATASSISDDWQEVESDAFSVVSLPTSEDGPLSASRGPTESPANSHGSESLLRLPLRPKYPDPAGPRPDSDSESESDNSTERDDDVERYGMDTKDVESQHSAEFHLNDILDTDIDPNFFYQVTTSLVKLITEIVGTIDFKHGSDTTPVDTGKIKIQCDTLKDRLRCLEPIFQGYSKHWKSEGSTIDIPIDPGLYEWMNGLRVELLGLQSVLQAWMTTGTSTSSQPWDSSTAKHYSDVLTDFSTQIDAFLPLLQADYDDFHTANLPVLSAYSSEPTTTMKTNAAPHMPPGLTLTLLRRELYALKDQISASLGEFEVPKKNAASGDTDVPAELMEVMNSYHTIKSSMDIMLSNHASDWIEYSLAGGLPYPEFCRLNTDTIRSLNLQLKELTDELNAEWNRVHSMRYLNDPDDLLQDEKPTFKKSLIDGLRTIEEVLQSLFQIQKPELEPKPKSEPQPTEA